jgi:hypothetical protein
MTSCLKSHRGRSRSRGHEALTFPNLRWMIPDGHPHIPHHFNRKLSIVYLRAFTSSPEIHPRQLNPLHGSELRINPHAELQAKTSKILKNILSQPIYFQPLARSLKVIKGNLRVKNSEFFSGHFDGKTLGNQAKTTKKTLQKHAKKWQFLTRFSNANLAPILYSQSSIFALPLAMVAPWPMALPSPAGPFSIASGPEIW